MFVRCLLRALDCFPAASVERIRRQRPAVSSLAATTNPNLSRPPSSRQPTVSSQCYRLCPNVLRSELDGNVLPCNVARCKWDRSTAARESFINVAYKHMYTYGSTQYTNADSLRDTLLLLYACVCVCAFEINIWKSTA